MSDHIDALLSQIEADGERERRDLTRILSAAAYTPRPSWWRRLLGRLR